LKQPAVEIVDLSKTYFKRRSLKDIVTHPIDFLIHPLKPEGKVEALKGINLQVDRGEILGFLGPNGAGKTTLIKILSCLILPDRGAVKVNGFDIRWEKSVKSSIGLVTSDERSFYWRLTGLENLKFFARLYDLPTDKIAGRARELIERMHLQEVAHRPFMSYSSGMKQRLSIARALLHDPPILFMDEPTKSLDPQSAMDLRSFIKKELNEKEEKTILLATHNLREAEDLCHRIAVMTEGQIKEIGPVEQIRRAGLTGIVFELEVSYLPPEIQQHFSFVKEEKLANGHLRAEILLEDDRDLSSLLKTIMQAGGQIYACDRRQPDLEEALSTILKGDAHRA
jgi:ABC-2 type transport system ATP-binding protein